MRKQNNSKNGGHISDRDRRDSMRNSLGIQNQPQSRVAYRDSVGRTTGR